MMAQAERKLKAKLKEEKARLKLEIEQIGKYKLPMTVVIGVLSLIVFVLTLNPHMGAGDSGTIITASFLAGINHPPGYPLYTMLGKLFTYLPFGSVGFRVNFMNAVMTMSASIVLFHAFLHVSRNVWGSFLGAMLFCFAPGVWHYAITAEVFPLNNLMIALMFYCLVLYVENLDKKYAYLGTLIFGLGMSNHHTIFFFGVPFALLVLIRGRDELLNIREILTICAIFFIGLLPYLYLVYAPNVNHVESWGATTTWDGFLTHLFRKEYGTFALRKDLKGGSFIQGIWEFSKQLPFELVFIGPLLAIYGLVQSWKKKLSYNGLLATSFAAFSLYVVVFHMLSQFDLSNVYFYGIVYRFWQMPIIIVCFWMALGLKEILEEKKINQNAAIAVVTLLVTLQIGLNYQKLDQSKNSIYYNFGKNILESLPQNALVLIKGDIFINSLIYTQNAGQIRPDVKILNLGRMKGTWYKDKVKGTYPEIIFPRKLMAPIGMDPVKIGRMDSYTLRDFIRVNFDKFPIYTNLNTQAFKDGDEEFDLWPWGLLYKVQIRKTPIDIDNYMAKSKEIIYKFKMPEGYIPPKDSHEEIVANYYNFGLESMAMQVAENARKNKLPELFMIVASEIVQERIKNFPKENFRTFKNLGLIYSMISGQKAKANMVRAWSEYMRTAPRNDGAYNYIAQQLKKVGAIRSNASTP